MKNNIKAIRKIRNISQQEIADALGVTITAVNKWENNFNIRIPDKRVKEISELLGVSEQDIMGEHLDIEKIRLKTIQEQLQEIRHYDKFSVYVINGEFTGEEGYEDINEWSAWKQSMYPVIESFVKENFAKELNSQELLILARNIILYMDKDSKKLSFLQRVVRFLVNENEDAELKALYDKHVQK